MDTHKNARLTPLSFGEGAGFQPVETQSADRIALAEHRTALRTSDASAREAGAAHEEYHRRERARH